MTFTIAPYARGGHPNGSFVPVRTSAQATWYIDGRAYFGAVHDAIDAASRTVYIEDWWLSPEVPKIC